MLEAPGFVGVFALWLKAEGYPIARINYYALGLVAVVRPIRRRGLQRNTP